MYRFLIGLGILIFTLLYDYARVSRDYELLLSDDDDGWDPERERDSPSTAPRLASRKMVKSVGKRLKKSLSVVAHSPGASRRSRPRSEASRYSYDGASAPSVEWLSPFGVCPSFQKCP